MKNVYTIYHNPRCSKSRKTLELLQEAGVSPEIIEYLNAPPSPEVLRDIVAKLGCEVRDIIRQKESAFTELGLDDDSLDDASLVAAMVENPILIERPIVVKGDQAVIGRPPENVLTLLN